MQLQENILFDNRYLLIKLLGRGGFSEVWLVEDTKVANKKMALKIYAPGMGLDEDGVKLFSSEFELVFDFNHSHLLRPTYFDICERSPYLLMPYCERGSSSKLIGKITEEEAWHFLHNVAAGLAHLHEQETPIIHQDIKPDNILIDSRNRFLITDFGISAKARNTLRRSVGEAQSGTVAYMPPERFGKHNTPIKASDVWALGATLFELMEGDVPFLDILGGQAQQNGAEIPEMTGNWSPELKKIITQCLQKETWDRPTAQQLMEWTEAHFRGEKLNLSQPPSTPAQKPNSRSTQRIEKPLPPQPQQNAKTSEKSSKKIIWAIIAAAVVIAGIVITINLIPKQDNNIATVEDTEEVIDSIEITENENTVEIPITEKPETPTEEPYKPEPKPEPAPEPKKLPEPYKYEPRPELIPEPEPREVAYEVIEEEDLFIIVESPPEFPGGDEARLRFLNTNIKYPQMAREAGIQGTVYVNFIVEKDGSITNVKIARGLDGGCDEECIRVTKMMPKWKPGTQRGKAVRVSFNMPIKFTMSD